MLGATIGRSPLLDAVSGRQGFVAVLAAPGTGKTTLLRRWDAADGRPFVWAAPPADEAGAQKLAADLAERIGTAADPFVLVLDDIHLHPDAGARVIRHLAGLPLPADVAVAVSGRELDRRALSRLRLRPELFEVSGADLALDETSAGAVLGEVADPAGVRLLVDRTRGWAAGLQLARRSLGRAGTSAEDFCGADPLVRDFVVSEVLDDLDPGMVDFMLRTSPFEELTGPFCDAVTATTGSQQRLELLERRHLFLSTLDREGRRFHWHPLIREALASELDRRDPDAARDLRTAGADWLAAHGAAREALTLRLVNGDRERALQLLADVVLPLFYAGSLDQVVEIIHGIGPDIAVSNGYLATMFAYAGMMTGDDICARRWTRAATEFYRAHAFADVDEHVAFLTLRAHLCAEGVHRMRLDAEAARVRVKESSQWHAPTLMLCGIAAGLCGDDRAAATLLEEAIHVSEESSAGPALLLSLAERAEFAPGSDDLIARALSAAAEGPYSRYPQAALAPALHAESLARTGDRQDALAALSTAHSFRAALGSGMPWLAVQLRVHMTRAMVALGDVAGARIVLAEAEEILRTLPDPGVLERQASLTAAALRPLRTEGAAGVSTLTTAELRLLPLLPSHLSFEEIAGRLHLSRNTIKTQAASVYRKLGVSSRSEAVDHAVRLGLVDA